MKIGTTVYTEHGKGKIVSIEEGDPFLYTVRFSEVEDDCGEYVLEDLCIRQSNRFSKLLKSKGSINRFGEERVTVHLRHRYTKPDGTKVFDVIQEGLALYEDKPAAPRENKSFERVTVENASPEQVRNAWHKVAMKRKRAQIF